MKNIHEMKTAINCFEAELFGKTNNLSEALKYFDDEALQHLNSAMILLFSTSAEIQRNRISDKRGR